VQPDYEDLRFELYCRIVAADTTISASAAFVKADSYAREYLHRA
jgi:hypothetical protein